MVDNRSKTSLIDVYEKIIFLCIDDYMFYMRAILIDDMLDAYLEQDLKAMHTISTRFIPNGDDNEQWRKIYLRHVIEIRNIVMAHYMRKPMRLKDTFIAVGAVHLYGEKGVLALIEKDGYTVSRVEL